MDYETKLPFDLKQTRLLNLRKALDNLNAKNKMEPIINLEQKYIDNLLNGGFFSQMPYVIFGTYMTGKTQICHQLCIQAFKNSIKTIFLDTENTFRPERVNELATINALDTNNVLKHILVSKILSNLAFQLKLDELEKVIQNEKIQLLIIDSINNYYRLERGDKKTPRHTSQTTFYKILQKINELTIRFKLVTIMTAQVAPNYNTEMPIKVIPVGSVFLIHFFSEFIYLSQKNNGIGTLHYVNSNYFPEKKVQYNITKNGIEDYRI